MLSAHPISHSLPPLYSEAEGPIVKFGTSLGIEFAHRRAPRFSSDPLPETRVIEKMCGHGGYPLR